MGGSWPVAGVPNLIEGQNCKATSPAVHAYNCIAWAAGDTQRWWWPDPMDAYWPPTVPCEVTVDAFLAAFATLGYQQVQDGSLESKVQKVALYCVAAGGKQTPTHAARQLANGKWTSKLGNFEDVRHDSPQDVEGLSMEPSTATWVVHAEVPISPAPHA